TRRKNTTAIDGHTQERSAGSRHHIIHDTVAQPFPLDLTRDSDLTPRSRGQPMLALLLSDDLPGMAIEVTQKADALRMLTMFESLRTSV
ncbi:hypothetical protein CABS02_14802, partial [Colletotrichum abscissum]